MLPAGRATGTRVMGGRAHRRNIGAHAAAARLSGTTRRAGARVVVAVAMRV